MQYSVYSEFDIDQHKKTFVNYLEVVIEEDGHVRYAVPSHQELGIGLACKKLGVTRNELNEMCPEEYYFDFVYWLSIVSGAMFVWNHAVEVANPTKKQIAKLKRLKYEGLYKGAIPVVK